MFNYTFWKVAPINASFHPGIQTRCGHCNANATQVAPDAKFYHAGKHRRGSVALGMEWARAFRLVHHPTCPAIAAQYKAADAAEQALNGPRHQIYLLQEAVSQAERELDRGYLAKLSSVQLSHIEQKLESARTALAEGRKRLAPLIAALEAKLAAAQTALETTRAESAPAATLAEFEKAMAKYLPLEDAQEPTPPGQQRVNGHLIDVF